jgi:hypothetical protein
MYDSNDQLNGLCKCTYNDITDFDNPTCPAGQIAGTVYPLLGKIECCETCPVTSESVNNNLPSNYNHVDKLYPVHYDYALLYENPEFINMVNDGKISKVSPLPHENKPQMINIPEHNIEPFTNNNIKNIEHMCVCNTIFNNANYIIIFCIILLTILGGIIFAKNKYFK